MSASDSYAQEAARFTDMRHWLKGTAIGSLIALAVSVILFGYLAAAGHSRGTEGIRLNVFDRIWVEVWIALVVILASIVLGLASNGYYSSPFIPESIVARPSFYGGWRRACCP